MAVAQQVPGIGGGEALGVQLALAVVAGEAEA
jgi:hypothetical protein